MNLQTVFAILTCILYCSTASIQLLSKLSLNTSEQWNISSSNFIDISLFDLGANSELVDPRFFTTYYKGDIDLSPKSVFMTCLTALYDLSRYNFERSFHLDDHKIWSKSKYDNVVINIFALSREFATKHEMWAVFAVLLHALQDDAFAFMRMTLFWTDAPGQERRPIGDIFLETADAPFDIRSSDIYNNFTGFINTSSTSISDPWTLPILPNVSDPSVSFTDNTITSLSAERSREVKVGFDGPTLYKWGVFSSISAAFLWMASLPRSALFQFPKQGFGGNRNNAHLEISHWPPPRTEAPFLEYADVTYMLYNISRYMYQNNRFRAGAFVLIIDEQPLANDTFTKV